MGWAYNGSTLDTMGGSRLEGRSYTDDCYAPQRGGGCGCLRGGSRKQKQRQRKRQTQRQRGGSCRGYTVDVASNDLGKVALYQGQKGGSNVITAYTAGYGMGPAHLTDNAHYLNVSGYNKQGGRRTRNRRRRSRRN